jgi:predicted amidohydrolase
MAKAGAELVFLPACFNMTTGPAHWDTLIKSRALDNQFYLAACASARNPAATYTSWGHSCAATPWGEYCAAADARESIIYADIDPGYIRKIRQEIPLGNS